MKKIKYLVIMALVFLSAHSVFARQKPSGIVSLAPSITYSIYALGLESRLSGITKYCPKGVSKKEVVGSILEPNIEKIIALNPAIVMVSKEANRLEDAERLRSLGIEVYVAEHDYDYLSLCGNFKALAKLLGAGSQAETIIADSNTRLARIKRLVSARDRKSVFWEIGSKPLFTAGSRNFINDYSNYTNSSNIFSDLKRRFAQVSVEEVIKLDPDMIFVVAMGADTQGEVNYWNAFSKMKAVKNKNIRLLEFSEVYAPTPGNFAASAEKCARLIHSEVFEKAK